MQTETEGEVIVIHSPEKLLSRQNLPYFIGISEQSSGSKVLSMNLVIIPPAGAADPHYHQGYETAIFVIQGQAKTHYGEGLRKSVITEAGDFIFIPPNLPHQPVNLSQTEPVIAVVARNDPNEQESVVHYMIKQEG